MKRVMTFLSIIIMFLLLTGFWGPKGSNSEEKRQSIQKMRNETLAELYNYAPYAKNEIRRAEGYAVFSNTGINVILLSAANGWGVAHDNKIGKDTYMKMVSGGIGIGLGVKDFRGIFVFSTDKALKHFVDKGWQAGAQVDAAAKSEEKGGALGAAIDVAPGIKLYQLTKNGLALQATIQGTKYWKDNKLN